MKKDAESVNRDNSIPPSGCWNCQFAEIVGKRPKNWKPGTHYKAACKAPQRRATHGISSIWMTEERPDLPMCEWFMRRSQS